MMDLLEKHTDSGAHPRETNKAPRRLCTAAEYERLSREGGTCPYCGSVFRGSMSARQPRPIFKASSLSARCGVR
jgi:hypothetical protein